MPGSIQHQHGEDRKRGPIALKIAIILITLVALMVAIKTIQHFSGNANESVTADAPALIHEDNGQESGHADPNGSPNSGENIDETKRDNPLHTESVKGAPGHAADTETSVITIGDLDREQAKKVTVPKDLRVRGMPQDTEIYTAILEQAYLEAATLLALTIPAMTKEEHTLASTVLDGIEVDGFDAPYHQASITAITRLSAQLTCRLISALVSDEQSRHEVEACIPGDSILYEVGYPGIIGVFAERQAQAWCIYLRGEGAKGISQAQRMEARLKSLPPSYRINRLYSSLELMVDIQMESGRMLGLTDVSPTILAEIRETMSTSVRANESVYARIFALMRARTQALRHVTAGVRP